MSGLISADPTFAESLQEYAARLGMPPEVAWLNWHPRLTATYAEWSTRPYRWNDEVWRSTPDPMRV